MFGYQMLFESARAALSTMSSGVKVAIVVVIAGGVIMNWCKM